MLNVIFFIDASKTRQIKIPYYVIHGIICFSAILLIWSAGSIYFIQNMIAERRAIELRLSDALKTIFAFEERYDKVYDDLYQPKSAEVASNKEPTEPGHQKAQKRITDQSTVAAVALPTEPTNGASMRSAQETIDEPAATKDKMSQDASTPPVDDSAPVILPIKKLPGAASDKSNDQEAQRPAQPSAIEKQLAHTTGFNKANSATPTPTTSLNTNKTPTLVTQFAPPTKVTSPTPTVSNTTTTSQSAPASTTTTNTVKPTTPAVAQELKPQTTQPSDVKIPIMLDGVALSYNGGVTVVKFNLKNLVPDKQAGYVAVVGKYTGADGSVSYLSAPANTRISKDGTVLEKTSAYRYSIKYFKVQSFNLSSVDAGGRNLKSVKIQIFNDIGAVQEKLVDANVPSAPVTLKQVPQPKAENVSAPGTQEKKL